MNDLDAGYWLGKWGIAPDEIQQIIRSKGWS
jgi:hypothetical protein